MSTQCIIHSKGDTVAVVVVEDLEPGTNVPGWIMETDETITLEAFEAVPLGHKIALRDIQAGDAILKDGREVGRAVSNIGRGRHVHVHNVTSTRW